MMDVTVNATLHFIDNSLVINKQERKGRLVEDVFRCLEVGNPLLVHYENGIDLIINLENLLYMEVEYEEAESSKM